MRDVRSLLPAEAAIASILAAGLWALQTRSWRQPGAAHEDRQDQIDKPSIAYWRDHSAGASRRRVTPMPRGSRPSTAAFTRSGARNASEIVILTCRMLHLSRAAICSTPVTGASNHLIKPPPAARDRCDECGAGLGANRSAVVRRHGSRHDDIASPFHWRLFPWDTQDKSIIVHRVRRIAVCLLCLQLDRQLIRLDLNSDDVVADEVAVFTFCGIPEMLADGASDESLDLGRRHPAHRSATPRLSVQEG